MDQKQQENGRGKTWELLPRVSSILLVLIGQTDMSISLFIKTNLIYGILSMRIIFS